MNSRPSFSGSLLRSAGFLNRNASAGLPGIRLALFALSTVLAVLAGTNLTGSELRIAATGIEFRGRVVGPDDKPIAGTNLYIVYDRNGEPVVRRLDPTRRDGSFQSTFDSKELDASMYPHALGFVAMAKGFGCQWRSAFSFEAMRTYAAEKGIPSPPGMNIAGMDIERTTTFRLTRDDVPLVGRIVDSDGRPVAGATVRLVAIVTGEDNSLNEFFAAVKAGEDWDVVRARGLRKLILPNMSQHMPAYRTDANGRFRVDGVGRERVAHLLIEAPTIETRLVYGCTRLGPTHEVLHLLEQPDSEVFSYFGARFQLVARRSVPIVGLVRDKKTGAPIAGATIRCLRIPDQPHASKYVQARSDSQGRYHLTGLAPGKGRSLLVLPPRDQPYLNVWKTVDLSLEGDAVEVDFRLVKGKWIRGRVTDTNNEPVQAKVEYEISSGNPLASTVSNYLSRVGTRGWHRTDADGRYSVPGLPGAGRVSVFAFDFGRYVRRASNYHAVKDVLVESETNNYDLVLDAGQTLGGEIRDPAGRSLSGTEASGLTEHGYWIPLDGSRFRVTAYRVDHPRTLLFFHRERKLAGGLVLKGRQSSPLDIQLRPWGTLTGRLVGADGKPLASGLVLNAVYRPSVPSGHGTFRERHYQVDKSGRFLIEGLAPGIPYDVWIMPEPGNVRSVGLLRSNVKVAAGENKDLGDLALSQIERFMVRRKDGTQRSGTQVDRQQTRNLDLETRARDAARKAREAARQAAEKSRRRK